LEESEWDRIFTLAGNIFVCKLRFPRQQDTLFPALTEAGFLALERVTWKTMVFSVGSASICRWNRRYSGVLASGQLPKGMENKAQKHYRIEDSGLIACQIEKLNSGNWVRFRTPLKQH
jgi:hypothetical protein